MAHHPCPVLGKAKGTWSWQGLPAHASNHLETKDPDDLSTLDTENMADLLYKHPLSPLAGAYTPASFAEYACLDDIQMAATYHFSTRTQTHTIRSVILPINVILDVPALTLALDPVLTAVMHTLVHLTQAVAATHSPTSEPLLESSFLDRIQQPSSLSDTTPAVIPNLHASLTCIDFKAVLPNQKQQGKQSKSKNKKVHTAPLQRSSTCTVLQVSCAHVEITKTLHSSLLQSPNLTRFFYQGSADRLYTYFTLYGIRAYLAVIPPSEQGTCVSIYTHMDKLLQHKHLPQAATATYLTTLSEYVPEANPQDILARAKDQSSTVTSENLPSVHFTTHRTASGAMQHVHTHINTAPGPPTATHRSPAKDQNSYFESKEPDPLFALSTSCPYPVLTLLSNTSLPNLNTASLAEQGVQVKVLIAPPTTSAGLTQVLVGDVVLGICPTTLAMLIDTAMVYSDCIQRQLVSHVSSIHPTVCTKTGDVYYNSSQNVH